MRIVNAFMVIITTAILWMLPITSAIYDFRTDLETDTFVVTTGVGVTTANVTLLNAIYDNDTDTISYTSNVTEYPAFSSFDTTTRELATSNLTANTTRSLVVSYDVTAMSGATGLDTLLGWLPYIYYMVWTAFPIAALAAIFSGRS